MDEEKKKLIIAALGSERIKFDEPLKYHTFHESEGLAPLFYIALNMREFIQVLELVYTLAVPFTILGSGTKFIVPEGGVTGIVIKNRTSAIKIGGIKGKVQKTGIGIEEALIDIDSGVSIAKVNEYLEVQSLKPLSISSSAKSTLGGAVFVDKNLQDQVQKIKIWENGEVNEIEVHTLQPRKNIVLSMVVKVQSKYL